MTLGCPESYASSINMRAAATAVAAALTTPPGVYNIADDEPLTKRAYADALADAAVATAWVRGPGRLAAVVGDRLTSLTRSVRDPNQRFKAASGCSARHYPSARAGWVATAASLPGSHGRACLLW